MLIYLDMMTFLLLVILDTRVLGLEELGVSQKLLALD
jgi:hypothetical protein